MNATLPTIDARIAAFAAAVRNELVDLPADEIDELVDGLEADLAEQASESDDFTVPDAADYAAELRAAAGLPERADAASTRLSLREHAATVMASASARIRSSRAGAWLLDFFIALRPLWWVARGWAMYALLRSTVGIYDSGVPAIPGENSGGWILLIALILLSVQWGRGRWAPVSWLRVTRVLVSVVTAIALPVVILAVIWHFNNLASTQYMGYYDTTQPGLAVDGERVRNIFAYDAEGNPVANVQLYDQDGRALTTIGKTGDPGAMQWDEYFLGGGGPVPVPLTGPGRAPVWNVFPLREMPADSAANPDPGAALTPSFPFPHVSSVESVATPSPSPAADVATPAPSPSVEPTPSVQPSPTSTPTPTPTSQVTP